MLPSCRAAINLVCANLRELSWRPQSLSPHITAPINPIPSYIVISDDASAENHQLLAVKIYLTVF